MKKKIRLIDIAERAGVSKMTVSLAMRDDPSISQETKTMVRKIADEMGYVPNRIAKGLTNGQTYTIAAMVGGALHDGYHNLFLKGVTDYAISKGYTLTIALTEGDKKSEKDIIKKLYEMSIDGYLVFHNGSSESCKFLDKMDIPFVLYTKYFENLNYSHVVCDDEYGGEWVTNYLIEMGHKRIAYVYDEALRNSSEVINRKKGYRKALEKAGITYDEKMILPYDFQYPPKEKAGEELFNCLKSEIPPTAIFVCNDIVAAGVLARIKSWGYRVPQDVSLVGYEGIPMGTFLDPALTTITSPVREMGRTACELLIDKIEGKVDKNKAVKISMKPELTIRKSVARREE